MGLQWSDPSLSLQPHLTLYAPATTYACDCTLYPPSFHYLESYLANSSSEETAGGESRNQYSSKHFHPNEDFENFIR